MAQLTLRKSKLPGRTLRRTLASNLCQHGFKDVTDFELCGLGCLASKTLINLLEVGERLCWGKLTKVPCPACDEPGVWLLQEFLDSALMFADLDSDSS